jgi:ubiquinol-cytochrome c reductase cytochrome b subunit
MSGIPHEHYTPATGFERWLHRRLPVVALMYDTLMIPTPKNLNWMWVWGIVLTFCLVLQIATGIVLVMHYTPHVDLAFASIQHIDRNVNGGGLLHDLHANGASLFFVAVYLHIFRGLYYGSYKAPREITWIIGILIYLCMMATAFMGYVLPWGQMSFWGATVITNLFSAIPVVGEEIVTWLWGGFAVGQPTLNRFYSLHYLLPFAIVGVVILHILALHQHGSNNPLGIDAKGPQDKIPFHPYYTAKDMFGLGVFLLFFSFWIFWAPNALGEPDNYIPANPLVTPSHIVPEWYLLPFYAILRAIPNKLLGVVAMFASIFILFLLPWLDTSRVRSARFRPIFKQFFWILVIDSIVLGYVGANPPEGWFITVGRVATAYYFLYFLVILPLVGWFERPLPLPSSISEPVLGAGTAAAGATRGKA